ncbi:MAG: DNA polymerase IV [Rubricoccaceae bacterium]
MHRKILHIDMDAFFASVAQRDDPSLRGRPVVVGGRSQRGVVSAASYEARRYGIRSAMPMAHARRLCPDLAVARPNGDAYREANRRIHEVFRRYTDLVEARSIDEAYLDVTSPKVGPASGQLIAEAIRTEIFEATGLTASAGVSFCTFLAKLASDLDKPDGLTVITPAEAPAFMAALPVEQFHGVGPATAKRLRALGLATGADLLLRGEAALRRDLGKTGSWLWRMARCEDTRPVQPHRERKSVGVERTVFRNLVAVDEMAEHVEHHAHELARRLTRHGLAGSTLTLKVKDHRFRVFSRSTTQPSALSEASELATLGRALLTTPIPPREPVRLLGLAVSGLVSRETAGRQLVLRLEGVM